MDVRASDAERDETVELLRSAAAEGRLTFEELADRIETATHAVTRAELVPLTADLPTALAVRESEPLEVRAIGEIKRSGTWVVPPDATFRSWMGSITLDLREATIPTGEVRIDAFSPFGNVDLLVPEGVFVDVRANTRFGTLKQENNNAASADAPRVILTGGTMFGTVKVRHKRLWEKLLKGR